MTGPRIVRAPRGTHPFRDCDNMMLLAEQLGIGSADLSRIEVRGGSIGELAYRFG